MNPLYITDPETKEVLVVKKNELNENFKVDKIGGYTANEVRRHFKRNYFHYYDNTDQTGIPVGSFKLIKTYPFYKEDKDSYIQTTMCIRGDSTNTATEVFFKLELVINDYTEIKPYNANIGNYLCIAGKALNFMLSMGRRGISYVFSPLGYNGNGIVNLYLGAQYSNENLLINGLEMRIIELL